MASSLPAGAACLMLAPEQLQHTTPVGVQVCWEGLDGVSKPGPRPGGGVTWAACISATLRGPAGLETPRLFTLQSPCALCETDPVSRGNEAGGWESRRCREEPQGSGQRCP